MERGSSGLMTIDYEFQLMCAVRLGHWVYGQFDCGQHPHDTQHALGKQMVGLLGQNLLSREGFHGLGTRRHHSIRDVIIGMVRAADLSPQSEPVGYMDGSHKPDIVCRRLNDPLQLLALDVTVAHTGSSSALRIHSDSVPGAAAAKAEDSKRAHYTKHHLQQGVQLTTLAFETYGRETQETAGFIKMVCQKAIGYEQGWQHHPFSRRWRCRIHTALQVGNARLIRRHLQHHHSRPLHVGDTGAQS